MIPQRALLDANVLFPQMLRDVLLSLRSNGVFAARWTNQIHDEWTRNLQRQRPDLAPTQLQRTRDLMNEQIDESLAENYQPLIATLVLPAQFLDALQRQRLTQFAAALRPFESQL